MAWSAPIIHAVGDVLTASDWNITSNDVSFLASTIGATVATSQTTTSTSFADLATVGPTATLTTGANAIVTLTANFTNTGTNNQCIMAYAISGATTLAATSATSASFYTQTSLNSAQLSATYLQTGLTAGSNTFTAKYAVNSGTGTFAFRNIIVMPLP